MCFSNGALFVPTVRPDGLNLPNLRARARRPSQRPGKPTERSEGLHDARALQPAAGAARLPANDHQLPLCRTKSSLNLLQFD